MREGMRVQELCSPSGLVASYAPDAGMVCASLRLAGEELLGQCRGLAAYADEGAIFGIPLLHPWANRLSRWGYAVGETRVELPRDSRRVHDDGRGLPIHGLVAGCSDWCVTHCAADAQAARLVAELDFAASPELLALFPFPHTLELDVRLEQSTLRVATTLRATGDVPVPIAFGYHPYFQLPGVPREAWQVTLPVRRRARLDPGCLPTGQTEAVSIPAGPLGARTYDDLFPELAPDPVFVLAGGGRRIELAFGEGYRVAVVYAPGDADVICFEPMTAATDPFDGGFPLALAQPGESFTARFALRAGMDPGEASPPG